MPRMQKFKIGDIVNHKILGRGIILGSEYTTKNSFTWFHIYNPTHDRFGYYIPASFTKIKDATPDTRVEAQKLLLNHCHTEKPGKYEFGDVLHENNASLFVLDDGRQYDGNNNTTYLIYNTATDKLVYMTFTGHAQVIQKSNTYTRKFASKIICDRLLAPAFDTTD